MRGKVGDKKAQVRRSGEKRQVEQQVEHQRELRDNPEQRQQKEKPGRILLQRALTAVAVLAAAWCAGQCWTIYYDLNDDSLMAQMLSGSYTGTPSARNIQSYYPLTAAEALLYRWNASIDWHGVFLLFVQYGCFVLIAWRLESCLSGRGRRRRAAALALEAAACAGLLLEHYVYVQYSVTVGIVGATVCFLFLTMDPKEGHLRQWIRELAVPVLLILIGFLLRSEMMLFVGPFAALAFLVRAVRQHLLREKGRREILRFLQVCGITLLLVLGGMGLCLLGNRAGYAGADWKAFYELFDARTELYDFQKLPTYEGNEAFYASIGLDRTQVQLLLNYNYGLDEDIDARTLGAVADYAREKAAAGESTGQRVREALWDYRAAMKGAGENAGEPYPVMALVLYLTALGSAVSCGMRHQMRHHEKKWGRTAWQCLLLGALLALRSALFLYLYYNHRPVARLTHSIYACEAVFLLWLTARNAGWSSRQGAAEDVGDAGAVRVSGGRKQDAVLPAALLVMAAGALVYGAVRQIQTTSADQTVRQESNAAYLELQAYAKEHAENIYLVDVYSTVSFSDPVGEAGNVPVNLDLLGGWGCKSPLEREKLTVLGAKEELLGDPKSEEGTGTAELLRTCDNVYVAAETAEDMTWLAEYYAFRGEKVTISAADRIGSSWVIYAVQ